MRKDEINMKSFLNTMYESFNIQKLASYKTGTIVAGEFYVPLRNLISKYEDTPYLVNKCAEVCIIDNGNITVLDSFTNERNQEFVKLLNNKVVNTGIVVGRLFRYYNMLSSINVTDTSLISINSDELIWKTGTKLHMLAPNVLEGPILNADTVIDVHELVNNNILTKYKRKPKGLFAKLKSIV